MTLNIIKIRFLFLDGGVMLRGITPMSLNDNVFYAYREMSDDTLCGNIIIGIEKIIANES